MKTVKKLPIFIIFAFLFALFFALFGWEKGGYAVADEGDYEHYMRGFEFTSYNVTYDISTDRTMSVKMDLTVHYTGIVSRGFIYDIPVNDGDRVRNLEAYKLEGGEEKSLEYAMEHEGEIISLEMDDDTIKTGKTSSYRIKYDYAITRPTDKNHIYLNAIGFGSEAKIDDVNVKINLPEGFKSADCYVGKAGGDEKGEAVIEGNSVTLTLSSLPAYNGVTFDLEFEEGVLSVKTDMTPYWIIIVASALFVLLFAAKFLFFNKHDITPIPCFTAEGVGDDPTSDMDPLMMGKLIDNHVDQSDITSLLYYWASKGYIKINMKDENDIILVRIFKELPEGAPDYQQTMYRQLFESRELVHINSLGNTFFATAEHVTKQVNAKNGKLYSGTSMAVAVIFTLIAALAIGLTPILMAMFMINERLLVIMPMFIVIPVFAAFAAAQWVRYRTLKFSKLKVALYLLLIAVVAMLFGGLYILFVPSYVIELVPKILLCAVGFAIAILSAFLVSRTPVYTQKLNKIMGFRDFIENVEKDKLETMLEGNPEFYYNILPYALVLGVSDIWEKKFEDLKMTPPSWAVGYSTTDAIFDMMLFHSLWRNVNVRMVRALVSHPSAGSHSGFNGSFGGFSGGGHGGGGFRGR